MNRVPGRLSILAVLKPSVLLSTMNPAYLFDLLFAHITATSQIGA